MADGQDTEAEQDGGNIFTDAIDAVADGAVNLVENTFGGEEARINNRLEAFDGYEEFRTHLQTEGPIQDSLTAIVGDMDAEGAQQAMLQRMETLAEQDPDVFKNLNTIIEAEGFEGFAGRVAENENLSAVFGDLMSDNENMSPENATTILESFASQIDENPEFFDTVNNAMDDHPGIVDTVVRTMASNPDGAFQQINMFLQGQEFLAGLGLDGLLGEGFDMSNFGLENIAEVLLAVLNGLNGMVDGLVGMAFDATRDQDPAMRAGNLDAGRDADPSAEPGPRLADAAPTQDPSMQARMQPSGPGSGPSGAG